MAGVLACASGWMEMTGEGRFGYKSVNLELDLLNLSICEMAKKYHDCIYG